MADGKEPGGRIKDRFKSFLFRNNQNTKVPTDPEKQALFLNDFWLDIGAASPLELRIEKIKEACTIAKTKHIDPVYINKLWMETRDLLQAHNSAQVRNLQFSFLKSLIQGQYKRLESLRSVFFQALKNHSIPEDFPSVIEVFEALTDNGKDIEFFENEVGSCMTSWLHSKNEFPVLLINLIKFNSIHLSHDVILDILNKMHDTCITTEQDHQMEYALKMVEQIICYSSVPQRSLYPITAMLCRTLNLQKFYSPSWNLMKNLLGTHLGHSCIQTLCQILQDPAIKNDWSVMRNAVFYIGMSLWGSRRISSLKYSSQSVLVSFLNALKANKNCVLAFEISLTMQRLVKKFGHELQSGTWDYILSITSELSILMTRCPSEENGLQQLSVSTHELISFIEQLYQTQVFDGSVNRLFQIVENCKEERPNQSVFLLIQYYLQSVNPIKDGWLQNLSGIAQKFFVDEKRSAIRLQLLSSLKTLIEKHFETYEEELIKQIVIPLFFEIKLEKDGDVLSEVVSLLISVCHVINSDSDQEIAIMEIINSVVNQLWLKHEKHSSYKHIEVAMEGVIQLFIKKFDKCHGLFASKAFGVIVDFLHNSYTRATVCDIEVLNVCRKSAFKLVLSLRCNENGNMGIYFSENNHVRYSVYLFKEPNPVQGEAGVSLSLERMVASTLKCLQWEKSFDVILAVLDGLSGWLENKALLVPTTSAQEKSYFEAEISTYRLEDLVNTLCDLLASSTDRQLLPVKDTPPHLLKYDLQVAALGALSCLVSYHRWLDILRQRHILRNLEHACTTRSAKQCVGTITLCLIELPNETVLRCLPSILIHLSQMSSTVHMATAILELLAMLAQLKDLYSNFNEDQYMSMFAVSLNYTNPMKFSQYVVSLAHYVIVTWFVNCRLNFRADFVKYITRHLHAADHKDAAKGEVEQIRNDLMESCIDVLARYAFSDCSTTPKRSPLAHFLFDDGPSCTWLIGNRLITITTSAKVTPKKLQHVKEFSKQTKPTTFFPKPTSKTSVISSSILSPFSRQIALEAPGKLQTFQSPGHLSSRSRHKSGGAVLRRANIEARQTTQSIRIINSTNALVNPEKSKFEIESASSPVPSSCAITSGWAEIYVRRPSGNSAWTMRIENALQPESNACNPSDVLHVHKFLQDVKEECESMKVATDASGSTSVADAGIVALSPVSVTEADSRPSSLPSISYMDLLSDSREPTTADEQPKTGDKVKVIQSKDDSSTTARSPASEGFVSQSLDIVPQSRQRSRTVSSVNDYKKSGAARAARQRRAGRPKADTQDLNLTPHGFISPHGNVLSSLSRPVTDSDGNTSHEGAPNGITGPQATKPISPCFVFLQLFQSSIGSSSMHRPQLLPDTPIIENAVQVLDMMTPYDMWKAGIVYVAKGQGSNGKEILANEHGSARYCNFLHGLGDLVQLSECDSHETFVGGLATDGSDGEFTYTWKEPMSQMVFHIATLIPNKENDLECSNKRRHLGNDHVLIVYDEAREYKPGCVIQGQFLNVEIIIQPLDGQTNRVQYYFHKENTKELLTPAINKWFVSDKNMPVLVRQLALHAHMAVKGSLQQSSKTSEAYTLNTLSRLKHIKRLRGKIMKEMEVEPGGDENKMSNVDDLNYNVEEFSAFVCR